jgi:hypothetical protein
MGAPMMRLDNSVVSTAGMFEGVKQQRKPSQDNSVRNSSQNRAPAADEYVPDFDEDLNAASAYSTRWSSKLLDHLAANTKDLATSPTATKQADDLSNPKAQTQKMVAVLKDLQNGSLLLAEIMSHEKDVLQFLDTFINALSKLNSVAKDLELALSKGLNSNEKAAIANCVTNFNNLVAAQNAAKDRSFWDCVMDFFKTLVNVVFLAVSIVEAGAELGTNPAADAACGAQLALTVNSAVQAACQLAVTIAVEAGLNPNDVIPEGVREMAQNGLLGLLHNKSLEKSIDVALNVATCLGGFGLVSGLVKDGLKELAKEGIKEVGKEAVSEATEAAAKKSSALVAKSTKQFAKATAVGIETVLTTVGGLGSIFANPNSAAAKDFGLIAGGMLSIAIVEISNAIMDSCGTSGETEGIVDGVLSTIAGVAEMGILMKMANTPMAAAKRTTEPETGEEMATLDADGKPAPTPAPAAKTGDYSGQGVMRSTIREEVEIEGITYDETPDKKGDEIYFKDRFTVSKDGTEIREKSKFRNGKVVSIRRFEIQGEDNALETSVGAKPLESDKNIDVKVSMPHAWELRDKLRMSGGFRVEKYTDDAEFNEGFFGKKLGFTKTQKTVNDSMHAENIYRRKVFGRNITFHFGRVMTAIGVASFDAAMNKMFTGITQIVMANLHYEASMAASKSAQNVKQRNQDMELDQQNLDMLQTQQKTFNTDIEQLSQMRGEIAQYVEQSLNTLGNEMFGSSMG